MENADFQSLNSSGRFATIDSSTPSIWSAALNSLVEVGHPQAIILISIQFTVLSISRVFFSFPSTRVSPRASNKAAMMYSMSFHTTLESA